MTADVAVVVSTVNAYQWSYEKPPPLCDVLNVTEVWSSPAGATRYKPYTMSVTCGWMRTRMCV